MKLEPDNSAKLPYGLLVLIAAQILCAAFFGADIIGDFVTMGSFASGQTHLYFELLAVISLIAAIAYELRYMFKMLRREAHLQRSVSIAAAAVHDVIEAHFDDWQLTPAEQDVAAFLVKGFGIAEIASMRGSAEGTIKAHLNAIYRKSGTHNRGEVLSLIIDSLMDGTAGRAGQHGYNG